MKVAFELTRFVNLLLLELESLFQKKNIYFYTLCMYKHVIDFKKLTFGDHLKVYDCAIVSLIP